MIDVYHLTKRYGDVVAVDDVSFTVSPGHVTGFLGPNGAGESTTMRMMLGLDAPTSGRVLVAGRATESWLHPCARSVHCSTQAPSTAGGPPPTICAGWPTATGSTAPGSEPCWSSWGSLTPPAAKWARSRSACSSIGAIAVGALAVSAFAVIGVGLGTIVKRASIANTLMALVVIGGQLVGTAIPASSQRFLPFNALQATVTVERSDDLMSPVVALRFIVGYAVIAVAVGAALLHRRDV